MDQVLAPPPLPPSGPVFPALPTTTAKNITRVLLTASAILVGVGGWYGKEAEVDPETTSKISEVVNIPGLVTAGTGILGIVLGLFQQKQHSDQAALAVSIAAASPPIDADGNQSYEHTLNAALTQAAQTRNYPAASQILSLIQNIGKAHNEIPDPEV